MKVARPISVFALTPAQMGWSQSQLEEAAARAAAQPVPQQQPVITPIESILPNGSVVGVSPLLAKYGVKQISKIDWSKYAGIAGVGQIPPWTPGQLSKIDWSRYSGISGAGQTLPGTPGQAPSQTPADALTKSAPAPQVETAKPATVSMAPSDPVVTPLTPAAAGEGFKDRSKSAWGIFSGSVTVLHVTQGMSQAQVVHLATASGIPQQQAASVADAALKLLHSQGGHAVQVGVVVGGIFAALATLLGYKQHAMTVGAVAAILAVALVPTLFKEKSPFIGKWNMNAIETSYELGIPPRQAVEEITEDKNGLKIVSTAIEEGGRRDQSTLQIKPDGKPHPAEQGRSVIATMKDHTLRLDYSQNGNVVETEARTLSSDEKKMTVTTAGHGANGASYKNVAVYDRE